MPRFALVAVLLLSPLALAALPPAALEALGPAADAVPEAPGWAREAIYWIGGAMAVLAALVVAVRRGNRWVRGLITELTEPLEATRAHAETAAGAAERAAQAQAEALRHRALDALADLRAGRPAGPVINGVFRAQVLDALAPAWLMFEDPEAAPGSPLVMEVINPVYTDFFGVTLGQYRRFTHYDVYPAPVARAYDLNDQEALRTMEPVEAVERVTTAVHGVPGYLSGRELVFRKRPFVDPLTGLRCILGTMVFPAGTPPMEMTPRLAMAMHGEKGTTPRERAEGAGGAG